MAIRLSTVSATAMAMLARLAIAHPLSADTLANITARQGPASETIAQILWFDGPDCDFAQSASSPLFWNVGTLNNDVYDPDQCDVGRPLFTDTANGDALAALPFSPRSFAVVDTPQTCNPDVQAGQYLGSVTLYPDCKQKINDPQNDPSLYCPGGCVQIGWSANDGYQTCINTPEFAESAGPLAYAVRQNIAYC